LSSASVKNPHQGDSVPVIWDSNPQRYGMILTSVVVKFKFPVIMVLIRSRMGGR
jgi:hypothetical protein